MLYAPWPEGPVAAAFVFFLLAPPVPMRRAEMSRGGPTQWGAQRPLTSEPGALHCAACEGGKKRRSNRQPSSATRGRGESTTSRQARAGSLGFRWGDELPAIWCPQHTARSKRPLDLPRSAATSAGYGAARPMSKPCLAAQPKAGAVQPRSVRVSVAALTGPPTAAQTGVPL